MKKNNLIKILSANLLAIPLVALSISSVRADTESVTFTLTNQTGYTITEFYASPPSENDWEEDILGQDVLDDEQYVNITIDDDREDCKYDFKAVLDVPEEEEDTLIHSSVEVCDGEGYVYE